MGTGTRTMGTGRGNNLWGVVGMGTGTTGTVGDGETSCCPRAALYKPQRQAHRLNEKEQTISSHYGRGIDGTTYRPVPDVELPAADSGIVAALGSVAAVGRRDYSVQNSVASSPCRH